MLLMLSECEYNFFSELTDWVKDNLQPLEGHSRPGSEAMIAQIKLNSLDNMLVMLLMLSEYEYNGLTESTWIVC